MPSSLRIFFEILEIHTLLGVDFFCLTIYNVVQTFFWRDKANVFFKFALSFVVFNIGVFKTMDLIINCEKIFCYSFAYGVKTDLRNLIVKNWHKPEIKRFVIDCKNVLNIDLKNKSYNELLSSTIENLDPPVFNKKLLTWLRSKSDDYLNRFTDEELLSLFKLKSK